MKRILVIILCFLCMTGCHKQNDDIKKEDKTNAFENTNAKENIGINNFNKEFGSYYVAENWTESREHSTSNKFFYVLKGHENDRRPNNISINYGENKYGKSNHEKFKTSILNQLSMQVSGKSDIEINANGFTNDNGDIVYEFVIKDRNSNVTTTQYYIVGDYEYILVHETVFEESEDADKVAKGIVKSFIWN